EGAAERGTAARRRQRRPTQVEVQVEAIVVDPHRPSEVAGHRQHPLPQTRRQVDPRLDHPLHVGVRERPVGAGREDRQPRNVHVPRRRLQVEEARVEARESLRGHGAMLGSAPMRRRPAVCGALAATVVSFNLWIALPAHAASDETAQVRAIDNVFAPAILRIQPGGTVEWTIDGNAPHTVTADDGSWGSGTLSPGATYTHTF